MDQIEYRTITKEDLDIYKNLILPDIYDELRYSESMESDYLCLAACTELKPVSVIIVDLEDNGDLNMLSIWTDQEYRRQGIASALLQKMTYVAYKLYDWEDLQYGDDIILKTMYCLEGVFREPFEKWLEKNAFTDFTIMKQADDTRPDICGATAEIHFYRM